MKKQKDIGLLLFLFIGSGLILASCKKDYVYGDIEPNTERMIVEFKDAATAKNVSMDFSSAVINLSVADIRFMARSYVQGNAVVKISADPDYVEQYNTDNGTAYDPLPPAYYALDGNEFTLTPSEKQKTVSIKLRPSDIADGNYALALSIAQAAGAEVSPVANKILIVVAVKNKYDGIYHLKGFFTRTDNPAYNRSFETEVEMITTGANSVAMYWPDAGDYAQPFSNNGSLTAFSNVAPEVYFNTADQVASMVNIYGDPTTGPFMTPYPATNSRFDGSGAVPRIFLKYYYNADPNNRIFADTLTYIGAR